MTKTLLVSEEKEVVLAYLETRKNKFKREMKQLAEQQLKILIGGD